MRRLFLELFHKQIFPGTPITSFLLFLSYIVVTPNIIGFEKNFSCHSHLGSIRNRSFKHSIREPGLDSDLWYSFSFGSWNHIRTARKIQPLHLLHCPQPYPVPLLKHNGFMFFHRLVIPLRSYLLIQFRSRLVHKIEWQENQSLNSIVFQEC